MQHKLKKRILLFALICISVSAQAQKRNFVYGEFLGSGILASVNYERQINKDFPLSIYAGIGTASVREKYISIPVGLRYALAINKTKKKFIDLAIGETASNGDLKLLMAVKLSPSYSHSNYSYLLPNIAYRTISKRNNAFRCTFGVIQTNFSGFPIIGF
jgi:hypothetical protein